jgi:acetylglutamate kinase
MKNLDQIITDNENKYYSHKFQSQKKPFALIKISGLCIIDNIKEIIESLTILSEKDLYPVVVYGWGKPLSEYMTHVGLKPTFIDGNRYTDQKVLEIIKKTNVKIEDIIKKAADDLDITFFKNIVFCKKLEKYGFVGEPEEINLECITNALPNNIIPFIAPLGYNTDEVLLNINADSLSSFLVNKLKPEKYIIITPTGGIYDENKKIIKKFSIDEDYEKILGFVSEGMKKKFIELCSLDFTKKTSIQIVSPGQLINELFTYKGSGTKIIPSYKINKSTLEEVDHSKISTVLYDAFEKNISLEYLFYNKEAMVFYEEDYDGIGIIKEFPEHLYLDKLAVTKKSKDTGIGTKIITEIIKYFENDSDKIGIFWKSQNKSYLTNFYSTIIKKYNGKVIEKGNWIFYVIGSEPTEELMNKTIKNDWVI